MASECPVCGSYVDENVPRADTEHDGERYVFESAKCKELFEGDPDEYT
jgi:YHS domain-containing protein